MEAIATKLYSDRKLEVADGFMLLYSINDHPINPAEVELRLHEALEIYELVCQRAVQRSASPDLGADVELRADARRRL